MPARKAARQSVKRRQRNIGVLRSARTAVRSARHAVDSEDAASAESALRHAASVLDRAVKKGVMHKNNASRRKARLATRFNRVQGTSAS